MKKIISFLFVSYSLLPSVWAASCPSGTVSHYGSCKVCSDGTYRSGADPQTCQLCSANTDYTYRHTGGDTAEFHDNRNDCFATVTFHGNGGKNNNQENITVEAHYSYNDNSSSCFLNDVALCSTSKTSYKITNAGIQNPGWSRAGRIFAGWYTDQNLTADSKLTQSTVFNGDANLYAKWVCGAGYYSSSNDCVTCEENYVCPGDDVRYSCSDESGGVFTHSDANGYKQSDCYAKLKLVISTDETIVVNAKWGSTGASSCLYNSGYACAMGGDGIYYRLSDVFASSAKLSNGSPISEIYNRDNNYLFQGWYKRPNFTGARVDSETQLSGDVTLYAKWINCNPKGGFVIDDGQCLCKEGYYLESGESKCSICPAGKYCPLGNKAYDCGGGTSNKFTHSLVGAKSINSCYASLVLNGNGGSIDGQQTKTLRVYYNSETSCNYNDKSSCGPDECVCHVTNDTYVLDDEVIGNTAPGVIFTNANAAFVGWYQNLSGDKVTDTTELSGDVTLYAKWGCHKGFYKDGDNCTACPNYLSTDGPGKTSAEDCKHYFQYGTNKTWVWPDTVTQGEIQNVK